MVGLVCGTLAGGLARGLPSLTWARVIAGAFGGPATSISYAIIADVIPPARRGKAMGAVMGAFSVAQVLGVPAALVVSDRFGWRVPFYAVSVLGGAVALAAVFLLPSLTLHRQRGAEEPIATLRRIGRAPDGADLVHDDGGADGVGLPRHPQPAGVRAEQPRLSARALQYLSPPAASPASSRCAWCGRLADRCGSFRAGTRRRRRCDWS